MPADAPLGALPLRIIRDGEASPVATVRVVESAFGIFSQNGHGWGPGQIYNNTGELNTVSNPARRGHRMTLQGTGLGTAKDISVLVGGRLATGVARHSAPDGIDRI